jgi:hypothetical protein
MPSPILPSSLVSLFGGTVIPLGVIQCSGEEAHAHSLLCQVVQQHFQRRRHVSNENNQFNAIIQYQVRKLSFTSGFARLEQGFSQSGTPPEVVSSYYVGVSRWFNFF